MNWKDFFYFEKRDKNAIITLLCLICIAGGIYIATKPQKATYTDKEKRVEKGERQQTEETNKAETSYSSREQTRSNNYTHQQKLKAGETVELNSADTSQLKMIPGIGSSYANRIIKYRDLLGGYASMRQLNEVYGMNPDLYSTIKGYLTLNEKIRQLQVNSAPFKELLRHPYLDYKQTKVIVDIRERKGRIESINQLGLLEEFTENDIKRLSSYLSFD